MSISKPSYHHHDLKNALIEAGVRLLTQEGMEQLSLRKLAREVGVSHNAPYMHFPNKEALLAAIAEQGFQLLGEAIEASQTERLHQGAEERLIAAASSYVGFALRYPGHLMVMFSQFNVSDYPQLAGIAHETFQKLVTIIREGQHSGEIRPLVPEQLALLIWTNMHGLSTLLIVGRVPSSAMPTPSHEEVTRAHIRMLCQGILVSPLAGG